MKKKSMVQTISAIIFTLALITNFACSADSSNNKDTTAPTVVSITPDGGSLLYGTEPVVIVFNEEMGTDSHSITGDMADAEAGGAWSTTTVENDTLTISPSTSWADGNGQVLTVDAMDVAGNAVEAVSLTYDIDAVVPTVLVRIPPDGMDNLNKVNTFALTFSETMKTDTLGLSGDMMTDGFSTPVWETVTVINDKVSINPPTSTGEWPGAGDTRTVYVKCKDIAGNQLEVDYTFLIEP